MFENIKTDRIAVSQREAARLLGVRRERIREAIFDGELELHRAPTGNVNRLLVSSLEKWVASWPKAPRARPTKKEAINA